MKNNKINKKKSLNIPTNDITSNINKIEKNIKILKKPDWLRVRFPVITTNINNIKSILRKNKLYSVCEEAQCPNLFECFNRGTATFMILGFICTRKCPFCAVKKGRPIVPDYYEPQKLYNVVMKLKLKYVVLTSVTRDDLHDGGAQHFYNCIRFIRNIKNIKIEILVPDFRNKTKIALNIFQSCPPDVFNHNIENVPRLYPSIRPGSNYHHSLNFLYTFKKYCPNIPTKSGLMLGLGERHDEVLSVLKDLKKIWCFYSYIRTIYAT
ncbi:lipoic acid synthetase (FeS enzyme) [Buchnera aphidicola (Cinara tujafilina)]|uniref:Lipoyl synthase n=1 Tax=Buchnera aphidicola (Cinara tujafilina) TaxID=261317 RepID=F7WZA2_9GAMM|nr:lipoic acid synthetase (FeS enzyme) [Buchnera aphidicola (Cinara tujafilina)]